MDVRLIDQMRSLAIFSMVADFGSFRAAAKNLDVSPATVSQNISKLEKQLGVPLFYRSTRTVSLTSHGNALLVHAKKMRRAAEQGVGQFTKSADGHITELLIAMPVSFTSHPLFSKLAKFTQEHRGIQLNILSSDRPQDLLSDKIDLAIRMGSLKDSELKSRKIGSETAMLIASPSYLQLKESVSDISSFDMISFDPVPDGLGSGKTFVGKEKQWGRNVVTADSIETIKNLLLNDLGAALIPYHCVKNDLEVGRLSRVLPESLDTQLGIYVVWARNASLNVKTRTLIDYLASE